jgi:predicted RNA binding protein YcfA (HicA-like mRNA interferase family)
MLEIWKPILALASFFDSKGFTLLTFTNSPSSLRSLMVQLCVENAKARMTEDMTETGETLLTQVLLKLVGEDGFYKVKTIKESMASLFDEEQKWLTTKWVANALRRLGFTEKRRVGTGYEYRLRRQEVQDLAKRMGVDESEQSRESQSLKEILQKTTEWIAKNRDEKGLIDLFSLTDFLSSLTDKPNSLVEILKREGWLFDVGTAGKLGVK